MKYLVLCLPILFACVTASKGSKSNINLSEKLNVNILMQTNFLHCGGAPPPRGGFPNQFNPLGEQIFYIKSGTTIDHNWQEAIKLSTDENGLDTLQLNAGSYILVHEDKLLSFDAFREKKRNKSTYFEESSTDCFTLWHNTPDFIFNVSADTNLVITLKQKCFVGSNPCLKYTGPLPN
jgi:hypothetical protein